MYTADIEKYLPPNPGQVIYTFYYLYYSILKLNITKSPSHYIFKHFLQVKKIKLLSNSTALILYEKKQIEQIIFNKYQCNKITRYLQKLNEIKKLILSVH